jgi:fatty acid desaturase
VPNVPLFLAPATYSFLNAVVIHNHMHQGVFQSKR